MRSASSARQLASHAARTWTARPSGTHRPPGRVSPPFVATSTRDRSPLHVASDLAIRRSLCPDSCSSRQYASAVSTSVTPASNAACSTPTARASSRSRSVERRMDPRPVRGPDAVIGHTPGSVLAARSVKKNGTPRAGGEIEFAGLCTSGTSERGGLMKIPSAFLSGNRGLTQGHVGRGRPSRRRFIGTAAAGGATLASALWPARLRAAASDPTPIPQTVAPGLPFHIMLPGGEPSSITNFSGVVGVAALSGEGTAIDTVTGQTERLLFDVDNRFMKGTYVGAGGQTYS